MAMRPRQTKKARYSPHPGLRMEAKGLAKLRADSGRTFDQWVAIATKSGLRAQRELRTWLSAEHGLASRNAWWIADAALLGHKPGYEEPEALVDALYSGPRAKKRELHERLIDEFIALGDDIIVTACKTMVPVYRQFVFAELRPVSAGVEVRLSQGASKIGKRLQAVKRGGSDRVTCGVVIQHEDEIDAELRTWIAHAYAAGAKRVERSTDVDMPTEFAAAMKKSKVALKTWAECTPAMQRDMIEWVTGAKQAATRTKRLAIAIAKLTEGKRRVY